MKQRMSIIACTLGLALSIGMLAQVVRHFVADHDEIAFGYVGWFFVLVFVLALLWDVKDD